MKRYWHLSSASSFDVARHLNLNHPQRTPDDHPDHSNRHIEDARSSLRQSLSAEKAQTGKHYRGRGFIVLKKVSFVEFQRWISCVLYMLEHSMVRRLKRETAMLVVRHRSKQVFKTATHSPVERCSLNASHWTLLNLRSSRYIELAERSDRVLDSGIRSSRKQALLDHPLRKI